MKIDATVEQLFVFPISLGGGSSNLLQMARRHVYELFGLQNRGGMTLPISQPEEHRRALAVALLAPRDGRKSKLLAVLYSTPVFVHEQDGQSLGYWETGTLEQWRSYSRYQLGVADALAELDDVRLQATADNAEIKVIEPEEALEMFNDRMEKQGFSRHVLR